MEAETVAGPLLLPRHDHVITPTLLTHGAWEPELTSYLRAVLRPGHTFVDVGAHVGYFSILASRCVGPGGTVIALEPEARNLDLLRRNLARNGCSNVDVFPVAACAVSGWMSLALDEHNRGAHRLVPAGEGEQAVRCVALDDLAPETVDVIKIDAQGYDHEVLAGAHRTLAANPRMVVVAELSPLELPQRAVDPAVVLAGYEALGFAISAFDDSGRLRGMSAAAVLERFHAPGCPDFSLVLERPRQPSFASGASGERPSRAEGLEVEETPDGLVVLQPRRNSRHQLNRTAAAVFDLCTGENTVSGIVAGIQQIYELADPPTAEVEECLARLRSEELIV